MRTDSLKEIRAYNNMAMTRFEWICNRTEGPSVLDIGCNVGIVSLLLARAGFDVVGVDRAQHRIQTAITDRARETLATQGRLSFICGDFFDATLPLYTFSTAIMGEFLEHLDRPDCAIARVYGLLADGARLIVTVPFGIAPCPSHKQTFYVASLYRLLSPYFVVNEADIIGSWLCLLCTKRPAALEEPVSTIEMGLAEMAERTFYSREVALTNQVASAQATLASEVGSAVINAAYRPGLNTILLPHRMLRLGIRGIRGIKEAKRARLEKPMLEDAGWRTQQYPLRQQECVTLEGE